MEQIYGHKIIFKAIVGSQSYGTSLPESDIDIKGVFIQNNDQILSFGYTEQINVNKDETYFEVRRFLELLQTANPTVLELLFTPENCILIKEPEFDMILENKEKFLTEKCKNSFGGYAVAQIKKAKGLNKKMNWLDEKLTRKTPYDFTYIFQNGKTIPIETFLAENHMEKEKCGLIALNHFRDSYALYYDNKGTMGFNGFSTDEGNALKLSNIPKNMDTIGVVSFNQDAYSKHCRDFRDYQTWLKYRNEQRYVDIENHSQKIDGKNLMHCRRLLDIAMEIPKMKTIQVKRPNAKFLIEIRKGKHDLESIITMSENDIVHLDSLYENSGLPKSCDPKFLFELLLSIRKMNQ
jgi:hypothetical protein